MRWVTIRHPGAGEATVAERSLRHYLATGWTVVEEPEQTAPEDEDAVDAADNKGKGRGVRRHDTDQESE